VTTLEESAPTADGLLTLSSARWPEHPDDVLTPLAGFIVSSFNPLVAQVAERCLSRYYTAAPAGDPDRARRTALVLTSLSWDRGTSTELAAVVAAGRRVQPLLFFQSNPNAVLGYVAARWGLGGPVVCLGLPPGLTEADPAAHQERLLAHAVAQAGLIIEDGDADEALVIAAEQASTAEESDSAVAVLVAPGAPRTRRPAAEPGARMTAEGRTR
jgi:hypothetical protein